LSRGGSLHERRSVHVPPSSILFAHAGMTEPVKCAALREPFGLGPSNGKTLGKSHEENPGRSLRKRRGLVPAQVRILLPAIYFIAKERSWLAFPFRLPPVLQMGFALLEPPFRFHMPDMACRNLHVIDSELLPYLRINILRCSASACHIARRRDHSVPQ